MFRRVIVGVDGRPASRDAIALARLLAGSEGTLTLAHVYAGPPGRQAGDARSGSAQQESQRLLEQTRDAADAQAELVSVQASGVGEGLHQLAETSEADLLTVGSCHRGFVGRVLLGNDTRAALNGSPCAVAVSPLGYAHDMRALRSIGVGYDGSPESDAALSAARQLAGERDARVHVLRVVQVPAAPYAAFAGVAWAAELDELLETARRDIEQLPDVEGDAVLGLAGEELAALGDRVDLLVVGSRSYGPLRALMFGSTSMHLAGHARCPLLVLPRSAAHPAPPSESAPAKSATPAVNPDR